MAYSLDLRQRVINYIQSNGSKISASKIFKISEKQFETGCYFIKKQGQLIRASIEVERGRVLILKNSNHTLM